MLSESEIIDLSVLKKVPKPFMVAQKVLEGRTVCYRTSSTQLEKKSKNPLPAATANQREHSWRSRYHTEEEVLTHAGEVMHQTLCLSRMKCWVTYQDRKDYRRGHSWLLSLIIGRKMYRSWCWCKVDTRMHHPQYSDNQSAFPHQLKLRLHNLVSTT